MKQLGIMGYKNYYHTAEPDINRSLWLVVMAIVLVLVIAIGGGMMYGMHESRSQTAAVTAQDADLAAKTR